MSDPIYMNELMIEMWGSHQRDESRNDTNIDGLMKRLKSRTIKGFSKDVSLLIFGVDEFQPFHFPLHQVTNEVISNFDMFWHWVLNRILG